MGNVNTPEKMDKPGLLKSFLALLIDALTGTAVVLIVFRLLFSVGFDIPEWAGWIPGLLVISYAYLGHQHKIPSLGNWSFMLAEYSPNSLEEYTNSKRGTVIEDLPPNTQILRILITLIVIGALFTIFFVI